MFIRLVIFFIFIWLAGINNISYSQQFTNNSNSSLDSINTYSLSDFTPITYFQDKSNAIQKLSEVQQKPFISAPDNLKFTTSNTAYWLNFQLANSTNETQEWWLDVNVFDSLMLITVADSTIA
ncbi:MAG: 7TM-DISM domain-containing protein, partial [Saprospiraceae bacterium]